MTLRARVLTLATSIAALVIVLAAIPIALLLRNAAIAEAEREATFAAQNVADYLSTSPHDDRVFAEYVDRLNDRTSTPVTVIMADGDLLGADLDDEISEAVEGRKDDWKGDRDGDGDGLGPVSSAEVIQTPGGRVVSVWAEESQGAARVLAVVSDDAVREDVQGRILAVAAAGVLLLALAALAAEVTSRRLVRPLKRTADTANRLSAGDLTARAPVGGPAEVSRVAVELNALADRIDELLVAERETIADLSHRLRTPLTAVRLSVESLPPGEGKTELEGHVETLERTLTQVIRSARRPEREGLHPKCDAVAVVRERLSFWSALAEDQERTVGLEVPEGPQWVRCAAEDLAAALDALLENVIAHTADGTAFAVAVEPRDDDVVVAVSDEGPGIPDGSTSRGRSDRGSTGLGLDIVRSTAQSVGGSMVIGRRENRTVVQVVLPRSQGQHSES